VTPAGRGGSIACCRVPSDSFPTNRPGGGSPLPGRLPGSVRRFGRGLGITRIVDRPLVDPLSTPDGASVFPRAREATGGRLTPTRWRDRHRYDRHRGLSTRAPSLQDGSGNGSAAPRCIDSRSTHAVWIRDRGYLGNPTSLEGSGKPISRNVMGCESARCWRHSWLRACRSVQPQAGSGGIPAIVSVWIAQSFAGRNNRNEN
jgi:hypothetical protein